MIDYDIMKMIYGEYIRIIKIYKNRGWKIYPRLFEWIIMRSIDVWNRKAMAILP